MDLEHKLALLTAILERAAATLGDITPHVMAAYYLRHPEAVAVFEHHEPGNRLSLEGEMVGEIVYCLMEWFEAPGKIEVVLVTTVPHHLATLEIPAVLFHDLITAVCETIGGTIPAAASAEQAIWAQLCREIHAVVGLEIAYMDPTWA